MVIVVILLVLAVIFILVQFWVITNLLRQNRTLESEVIRTNVVVDDVERMYDFFMKLFTTTLSDMERIDKLGAFKSDDEVGYIFNTLLESIKQVKFKLEQIKKLPANDGDDGVKNE